MISPRSLVPLLLALAPLRIAAGSLGADGKEGDAASTRATTRARACPAAESRQFDFWLGDWELERSDGARARVRVTSTHDGCVIQEDFDAAPAMPLTGRSLASWDPQTRGWRQTWVDNQGSFFSFTGGMDDGRMTLTAPHVNAGKPSLHRRVWSAVTADSYEWDWVTSDDGGRTWRSAWKFVARRVRGSAAAPVVAPAAPSRPATSPAPGPLAAFAWLEGRWEGTMPNGIRADITYTDARAGTVAGAMRLHNAAGDTLMMVELLVLSESPDGVMMRARHFSRDLRIGEDSAMTMRYTGGTPDSLHFVTTRGLSVDVAYLRRGPDVHIARSIIHRSGLPDRVIEVTYHRRR